MCKEYGLSPDTKEGRTVTRRERGKDQESQQTRYKYQRECTRSMESLPRQWYASMKEPRGRGYGAIGVLSVHVRLQLATMDRMGSWSKMYNTVKGALSHIGHRILGKRQHLPTRFFYGAISIHQCSPSRRYLRTFKVILFSIASLLEVRRRGEGHHLGSTSQT